MSRQLLLPLADFLDKQGRDLLNRRLAPLADESQDTVLAAHRQVSESHLACLVNPEAAPEQESDEQVIASGPQATTWTRVVETGKRDREQAGDLVWCQYLRGRRSIGVDAPNPLVNRIGSVVETPRNRLAIERAGNRDPSSTKIRRVRLIGQSSACRPVVSASRCSQSSGEGAHLVAAGLEWTDAAFMPKKPREVLEVNGIGADGVRRLKPFEHAARDVDCRVVQGDCG